MSAEHDEGELVKILGHRPPHSFLLSRALLAATASALIACGSSGGAPSRSTPDASLSDGNSPDGASDGAVGDATLGDASDARVGDAAVGDDASAPDAPAVDGGDSAADGFPDAAADAAALVSIQILAFNDFHGNLRPPIPSNAVVIVPPGDPAISDAGSPVPTTAGGADGGTNVQIFAGGASYLAAKVNALRATNPNTLLVSAGDLTGASPLVSSAFDDEPTIRVMNAIGLDVNGVGEHEFDHGPAELLRLQSGGCDVSDRVDAGALTTGSCEATPTFPGGAFEYLAADVDVSTSPKKTIFPPYVVKSIGGAKVAFVGVTLKGTPAIVNAAGTAGLTFDDEVDSVNALVPVLKNQEEADAIVVLVHQGGIQSGTYDQCVGFSGGPVQAGTKDIIAIADGLDPAVDVIASAHTHVAYNCVRGGRPVTSAASYGRIITQFNLTVDTVQHKVTSTTARNVVVTRDQTPDPTVDSMVQGYVADIAPIAERKVGQISADITRVAGANGEAPLGDVVADALLAAGAGSGAVAAFTNIGGLRDSLLYKQYYAEGDGTVTFEKAQAVTPLGNKVVILSCRGTALINSTQQNVYTGSLNLLQVSNGFTYTWHRSAVGSGGMGAADPTTISLGGAPINPTATYTIVTTDFLQSGGDGYTAFGACTRTATLPGVDLDYLTSYLTSKESPPLAPPAANRITVLP
jgi:5'-nucleotidase